MINKVTPRTRNSETDSRYVTPDQYTDALNIRVENSNNEQGTTIPSSNFGVVKPVKGTTQIDSTGLVIVGKVVDDRAGVAYVACIGPDASNNGVYRLDSSGLNAVVKSSYFNWNASSRVDMAITYRTGEGTGAVIYMTDNVNEPMKCDVDFHENNTVSGERLWHAITVCTPTPQESPITSFGYNQGQAELSSVSNFRNLPGVQFAYQNIHETGEVSPLSAYSSLAVPPAYLQQGANEKDDVDNYNSLQIDIPAQATSVERVRLLMRFGESGAWYIVSELESGGSALTTYFSNREILSVLPEQQTKRAFENVPQAAKTNEVVEDRLFYGNYREGYDNTSVTASMGVSYKERPDDFRALDIEVESQVAQVDNDNFTSDELQNKVAGMYLKITNPTGEVIPAGSTVSFDMSFAPDKNLHLYESCRSYHSNNELYGYNTTTPSENFSSYYDKDKSPSISKNAWVRGNYGVGNTGASIQIGSLGIGGNRVGISDDVLQNTSATWEVKAGPYEDEQVEVVYGTSPSNPLILRGGELSFSVKFKTTQPITEAQALTLIKQTLKGDSSPMILPIGGAPAAELITSNVLSTYSYDLGIGNREVIQRNSSLTDLICHCADKGQVEGYTGSGTETHPSPVGFFIVNKVTLDFKLRDLDGLNGLSLSDSEAFLALDIVKVRDYELRTCVPVFGNTDSDWFASTPFVTSNVSGVVATENADSNPFISDGVYQLNQFTSIQRWVAFDPNAVGAPMSQPTALELFSTLNGSSSGTTYKNLIDNVTDASPGEIAALNTSAAGGNMIRANKLKWFGKLKPANTTTETVGAQIGGVAGGVTTTEVLGDLFVPFEEQALRTDALLDQIAVAGAVTSLINYKNYAFSMLDGEGGIGSWKGSLTDTALVFSAAAADANTEWSALGLPNPFTEDQVRASMGGYGGKIEGSIPSSLITVGQLLTSARAIGDDRNESTGVSASGFYPDDGEMANPDYSYGPTLVGFNFPFQYLYTGASTDLESGVSYKDNPLLGSSNSASELDKEIIRTYSLFDSTNGPDQITPVPGYLKINPDDAGDEQPSSLEVLSNNTFILSAQDDAEGFKSFKRYSDHDFGVVYYDRFGRSGGVNPLPSVYVAGYAQAEGSADAVGQGGVSIGCSITSSPPLWAHSYRFVYGGNSTTSDFIQYMAGGAFVAAEDEDDEGTLGNIYVSLNYLQGNSDVSYANAFGAVSDIGDKNLYKYKAGDKVRVLSYFTGDALDSRAFPVNYVFDVVDQVTLTDSADNPLHNDSDGDVPNFKTGQFLVLKSNPGASGFTYVDVRNGENDPNATSHRWGDRAVIEIFSPTAKQDAEERVYREIGPAYSVLNQSNTLVHEYQDHVITDGDVWFRRIAMNVPKYASQGGFFRNLVKASNASSPRFLNYYVESNRFTDMFPGTKVIGKGKAKVFLPNNRQLRRASSVTYSDLNNPAAVFNKLSTFDNTTANLKNLPNEHGEIDKIHRDGDSLTVFQNRKTSFLPINRSVISDASDNASLIASSKVVGTQVFVPGAYGTGGNPESVLYVDGYYYFANRFRKEVYRYRPGAGVEVISDMGMKDYFHGLFDGSSESTRIVTGFDYLNDEFLIDITPYQGNSYSTNPDVIIQNNGSQTTTESGAEGITFVDPTAVVVDPTQYDTLLGTVEGLEGEISELETLVESLQNSLDQAYNDVTTVVVTVDDPLPTGAEFDGDTVLPGADTTIPDPIESTQEYVVAVQAMIETQEALHQAINERLNLAINLPNAFINNGYVNNDLWDRTGIPQPTPEQLYDIAEQITGESSLDPYSNFLEKFAALSPLTVVPLGYSIAEQTYSFPYALGTGEVTGEFSGFQTTYIQGFGVGINPDALDTIVSETAVGGVDSVLNIIGNFFPTPIEGSYVAATGDYPLSGITNAISEFLEARSIAIQVLNEYIADASSVITEELDVVKGELVTQTAQYIKDIKDLAAVINSIPKPSVDGQGDPVSWVSSGTAGENFLKEVPNLSDDQILPARNEFAVFNSNIISGSIGDQLQTGFTVDFSSIVSDNDSLVNVRDVLASQVYELVQGIGDGFLDKLPPDTSPADVFVNQTLSALYESNGSVADVLDIIANTDAGDGGITATDIVSETDVEISTSDIIDTVTFFNQEAAIEERFVSDGLDDAVSNVINVMTDLVTETSGGIDFSGTANEDDAILAEFVNGQSDAVISNLTSGTLVEKLNKIADLVGSEEVGINRRGDNGFASAKVKFGIMKSMIRYIEEALVGGSMSSYSDAYGTITSGEGFLSESRGGFGISSSLNNNPAYSGFLDPTVPQASTEIDPADVVQTSATYSAAAIKGTGSSASDRNTLVSIANDVQYVVNRLADFQRLLGGLNQGPSLEQTFALGLSDAVLGRSGVTAENTLSITDPYLEYQGSEVSAIYGIRLMLDALTGKFSPENFPNQLQDATGYVAGVEVDAANVFGVNEGQVSSLFGPVSQTAVGDEAEADFGLFTFDPVQ